MAAPVVNTLSKRNLMDTAADYVDDDIVKVAQAVCCAYVDLCFGEGREGVQNGREYNRIVLSLNRGLDFEEESQLRALAETLLGGATLMFYFDSRRSATNIAVVLFGDIV